MNANLFYIKTLVTLVLLSGAIFMNGQSLIKQEIDDRINQRVEFQEFSLFSLTTINDPKIEETVKAPTFLKLDKAELKRLYKQGPSSIQLTIPKAGSNGTTVLLYRNSILSEELTVQYKNEAINKTSEDNGIHYWGINPAAGNSLVAISIFEEDLKGLISDDLGNWNLGKLANKEDIFIYYNDKNLLNQSPNLSCGTKDDLYIQIPEETSVNKGNNPKCVDIYVEVNYDIYLTHFGNTNAFVTSIFNQSAILYANRGITIRLSDMLIWTIPSPYNGVNSTQMLNQFQAQTNFWNGDIAHLLTYHAYGGLAATINGLCHPNMDSRMCYSGIENNIVNNVPIYSWTVYVFSHENGHLLGSPHTHNCSWNGNNTAIDGCWTPEGSCSQPGIPSNGGTVMSYCHQLPIGVNFANGFHPQVGNRMNNAINSAGCLALCNGPACTVSVSPSSISTTPAGGNNSTFVTATTGQAWSASSNTFWITVTSGSGNGSGTLGFNVAANTGPARTGTISISCATSATTVTVYQADGGCVANLSLNGAVSGTLNYSASNTISSTQTLHNQSNVDYSGGNQVSLKPGFRAFSGAQFHGHIASCFNGQTTGTNTNKSSSNTPNSLHINNGFVTIHPIKPLTLELTLQSSADFSFQIRNHAGKEVLSEPQNKLKVGTHNYDLSTLPAGIYLVTVVVGGEEKTMKVIVEE